MNHHVVKSVYGVTPSTDLLFFSMLQYIQRKLFCIENGREVITSACQPVHRFVADIIPANPINNIIPSSAFS